MSPGCLSEGAVRALDNGLAWASDPVARGWPQTRQEFEAVVEDLQDRLVRYAFLRLGSLQEAEDIVQEVFVRAYADRRNRRAVTQVRSYLYRMAANACTDLLRKRERSGVPVETVEAMNLPDGRKSSFEIASALEELQRIEAVLKRLPGRQSEVIRLRVFDELPFVEIAEVLGRSPATVKSRFRYGLRKLRKIVRNEWEVRK
jgi:RNA polymerase sigma-70 factor (ECF subfamily)